MGDNANSMIEVPVVKFGNKRDTVAVPQGSTWRDVYNQIEDAPNKYVCVYGDSIEEHLDEQVKEDVTVFIAPKKIAQG